MMGKKLLLLLYISAAILITSSMSVNISFEEDTDSKRYFKCKVKVGRSNYIKSTLDLGENTASNMIMKYQKTNSDTTYWMKFSFPNNKVFGQRSELNIYIDAEQFTAAVEKASDRGINQLTSLQGVTFEYFDNYSGSSSQVEQNTKFQFRVKPLTSSQVGSQRSMSIIEFFNRLQLLNIVES